MPRLEGTLQAHRHSCWLLVSPRICPSGGRGELSFSQHGYLWPEYFNLALDFENGSRKNLIFSIHILMVVIKLQEETEIWLFEGRLNCAFRRNDLCSLHGNPMLCAVSCIIYTYWKHYLVQHWGRWAELRQELRLHVLIWQKSQGAQSVQTEFFLDTVRSKIADWLIQMEGCSVLGVGEIGFQYPSWGF